MKVYRLALIGFGNVGQGFVRILQNKIGFFEEHYGFKVEIVAVSDLLKGSVYNPEGLSISDLQQAIEADGTLKKISAPYKDWDALKTIIETNSDIVVELSYTDLKTGQPALSHIETALNNQKHVITTNKGPIALHYPTLAQLAKKNKRHLGIEGTVMSGTPALFLGQASLRAAGIREIQGILNGTTNYILTRMETGLSYQEALLEAQREGYAEVDPRGDVEGYDAAGKIVILANLFMNANIGIGDVDRLGITHITNEDILTAQSSQKRYKLIGRASYEDNQIHVSVKPELLPLSHPLASISGATNAITYTTELLGEVTLIGSGAGRIETGYALVEDLMTIHDKFQF